MVQSRDGVAPQQLSAAKAVVVGHLVVTVPVLLVIAVAAVVGRTSGHATAGLVVGCLVGWVLWSFLVPRWRDWVSTTSAPAGEVQRLAQLTGLVWRQGSALERTEMRRRSGQPGVTGGTGTYLELRNQVLSLDPGPAGLTARPGDRVSWGCVIETGSSVGSITLVCLGDGTTSLYASSGFSIIGGGGHEAVVRETEALLDLLDQHLAAMSPGRDQSLPGEGRAIIRALTDHGQLSFEADEDDLANGRSAMSPVFQAGQAVIAQLRSINEPHR